MRRLSHIEPIFIHVDISSSSSFSCWAVFHCMHIYFIHSVAGYAEYLPFASPNVLVSLPHHAPGHSSLWTWSVSPFPSGFLWGSANGEVWLEIRGRGSRSQGCLRLTACFLWGSLLSWQPFCWNSFWVWATTYCLPPFRGKSGSSSAFLSLGY